MAKHDIYIDMATEMALCSVEKGSGPFGAVIVDSDGHVISCDHNQVVTHNDPTAHAEIVCIRNACKKLNTFSLPGCTIYSSCEPCSMCLSACYWARLSKIVYGNTREDAKEIGFDDDYIYQEIGKSRHERVIPMTQVGHDITIKSFKAWHEKQDKTIY